MGGVGLPSKYSSVNSIERLGNSHHALCDDDHKSYDLRRGGVGKGGGQVRSGGG